MIVAHDASIIRCFIRHPNLLQLGTREEKRCGNPQKKGGTKKKVLSSRSSSVVNQTPQFFLLKLLLLLVTQS